MEPWGRRREAGGGGHCPLAKSRRKWHWLTANPRMPGSRSLWRFSKARERRGGPVRGTPPGGCGCGWQGEPRPHLLRLPGLRGFRPQPHPLGRGRPPEPRAEWARPRPSGRGPVPGGSRGLLTAQQQLQVRVAHQLGHGPGVVADGVACAGRGGMLAGEGLPGGRSGGSDPLLPFQGPTPFPASGPWHPGPVAWPVLGGRARVLRWCGSPSEGAGHLGRALPRSACGGCSCAGS